MNEKDIGECPCVSRSYRGRKTAFLYLHKSSYQNWEQIESWFRELGVTGQIVIRQIMDDVENDVSDGESIDEVRFIEVEFDAKTKNKDKSQSAK